MKKIKNVGIVILLLLVCYVFLNKENNIGFIKSQDIVEVDNTSPDKDKIPLPYSPSIISKMDIY